MADIGKLALVVSANAENLGKDLAAAKTKMSKFGADAAEAANKAAHKKSGLKQPYMKDVDYTKPMGFAKPGGDAGGGGPGMAAFLGGAVGAAAVAGVTAVANGVAALAGSLGDARKNAMELGQRFDAIDSDSLDRVDRAVHGVKSAFAGTFARLIASAEPAITAVAVSLVDLLNKATPVFRWLIDKGAVALSIGMQAVSGFIGIVAEQVGTLFGEFAKDSGLSSWFDSWGDWGQNVKAVMKGMAKGFAYVWDTAKAFGGVVAQNFALMAEGSAKLIRFMQENRKFATGAAATFAGPAGLLAGWLSGPDGAKKADILEDLAKAARKAGKSMVGSFGMTSLQIDNLFDGIEARIKDAESRLPAKLVQYSPTAALQKGTAAEFSATTKATFEAKFGQQQQSEQKAQTAAIKTGNDLLKQIRDSLRGLNLEVI